MKQTIAMLTAAGVLAMSGVFVTVGAQATKSVNDGVYTADQAKRGEGLYKDNCAACHGDDLAGSGPMPALAGNDFVASWKDRTLSELFEKTHDTMPATAPGSLSEQQTSDILAFMLSAGKFPAGATELAPSMDPLKTIKIEAKK